MIFQSEYERASQRYAWTAGGAVVAAVSLFYSIQGLSVLLLSPHAGAIRQWAQGVGPVAKTFVAMALLLAPSPIALAILVVVVRRARRKPILHCPDCGSFIGNHESAKYMKATGKCPTCDSQLIQQCDLAPDVAIKPKAPMWPIPIGLCAFGVVNLVLAIPRPLAVQCVLAVVAVVNFLVAGYIVRNRKVRLERNSAQREQNP